MPEQGLKWMDKEHLLSFEEMTRVVRILADMGLTRVRLTGGEPLLRKGIVDLVGMLAAIDGIEDLSMTTNAHLLARHASDLADAGLTRLNISLDSVDADQFKRMTRGGDLTRVLKGIDAARLAGLSPIKINAVMVEGENEDQLDAMIEYFAQYAADTQVRFIEAMPFGNQRKRTHFSADVMRARLSRKYTLLPLTAKQGGGPATMWTVAELGLKVGFISPITGHFCEACNRMRLMADGHLRTCLSKDAMPSLKEWLRADASDDALKRAIRFQVWQKVAGHEAHRLRDWKSFDGAMSQIGG
jgi:cyclic pyranopterin phosphate synthase